MSEHPVAAEVTHRFRASAEAVFDAFLDPALARRWFGPGLGAMTRVEIDARVGGTFCLVQRRGDEDAVHTGEYLELDRPRRLVFTWKTSMDPEPSRVVIDITPLAIGCELRLRHEMAPKWQDFADRAASAWRTMIAEIEKLLGSAAAGR
jgi:uncharacterized protein YndB with AHSA1/START domain